MMKRNVHFASWRSFDTGLPDVCPACQRHLPPKILVTFFDAQTKRSAGKTVDHRDWACLKLHRDGGMEN